MTDYYVQTSLGTDGYGNDRLLYDVVFISETGEATVYESYIKESLAVIRTLDLNGKKKLPYLHSFKELTKT